ncbi:hypothetical protein D3C71_2188060 [compost metagenome]
MFGLAGVQPWADVGIGPGEYHQGLGAGFQVAPLWIGPGHVAVEAAVRPLLGVQQQRQMAGLQTVFTVGD